MRGMIKRTPSDFKVEEFLSPDFLAGKIAPQIEAPAAAAAENSEQPEAAPPAANAVFTLFRLTKESLSTPEAAAAVARALKLKPGTVAYAGLKDKHARTIQHVTIKQEISPDAAVTELPAQLADSGWTLEKLGPAPRALTPGDIACNRFTIVARNLTEQECFDMEEAANLIAVKHDNGERSLRFVNYFGDQRFGSARHGQGFLAKHLIKGDFESALKLAIATESRKDRMQDKIFKRILLENWGNFKKILPKLRPCPERRAVERLANSSGDFRAAFCALPYLTQQLSVYAYQSHLWNGIARRVVEKCCAPLGKVIAVDDPFGEMLFPEIAAIAPELNGLDLPLLARKTQLLPPWKEAAESVLKEEGIEVSELQIPGVRRPFFGEEPRRLLVNADDFQINHAERDESATNNKRKKRTLRFTLPRGCYATVLLRALGQ